YSKYEQNNREGVLKFVNKVFNSDQIEYLKVLARYVKNGDKINSSYYLFNGQKKSIRYIVERSSRLLPNSNSEYRRLAHDYKISAPYTSIPNAIDIKYFNDDVVPDNNFKNHILCVGRIEGR